MLPKSCGISIYRCLSLPCYTGLVCTHTKSLTRLIFLNVSLSSLSGHASTVPGGDVHSERDSGALLPGCDWQRVPVVPGGSRAAGRPLYSAAHGFSGLHSRTQTIRQHHTVTFPDPHCLQHSGPDHSACLRERGRIPSQVNAGISLYSVSP